MTADKSAKKWSDEAVAQLEQIVGNESPVSNNAVKSAATMLCVTERSVASKLRKMGYEVASMAKAKESTFTQDEGDALAEFVDNNTGLYTYKEIAEQFADGKFSAKQIQGKILALELTGSVKATEQVVAASKYSEDEEAEFITLANKGAYIEDIAAALNREVASIRGKALSLTTKGLIESIPPQRTSTAKDKVDPIGALGEEISGMTVAEVALATGQTERGVKTTATRRGIDLVDYKGSEKKAKAQAKAEKAA